MAVGTPAGTFLGQHLGWRVMLAVLGTAGLATAGWARAVLPALPGAPRKAEPPTPDTHHSPDATSASDSGSGVARGRAFLAPALLALYVAAFLFEVGHMASYTYASQLAAQAGHLNPGLLLLAVGIGAVIGLVSSGRLLDKSPVRFLSIDLTALAGALTLLWLVGETSSGTLVAAVVWGLALGPATTLAQAVASTLAGRSADLAQGVLVTVLNAGMAAGAATGGALLTTGPTHHLPAASAALLFTAALASLLARGRSTGRSAQTQ